MRCVGIEAATRMRMSFCRGSIRTKSKSIGWKTFANEQRLTGELRQQRSFADFMRYLE